MRVRVSPPGSAPRGRAGSEVCLFLRAALLAHVLLLWKQSLAAEADAKLSSAVSQQHDHGSVKARIQREDAGQRTLVLACDLPILKKPAWMKQWSLEHPLAHVQTTRSGAAAAAPAGTSHLGAGKASFSGAYQAIIRSASRLQVNTTQTCKQLGWNSSMHGRFVKDEGNGHLHYHLNHCQPRRLSPPEALMCLSTRHVAMVGDSLSRFQFISLARFLTHGRFQRPYDNEAEGLTVLSGPAQQQQQQGGGGGGVATALAGLAGRQLQQALAGAAAAGGALQAMSEGPSGASMALSPGAWERFFERTQRLLSRRGCVNTTCRCYRNASDHAPGEDALSRAHEYWRVRLTLEDSSSVHLSMGLVYAFPDFATAGVNGLRWAFTAAKNKAPDVVVFNMGIWWGYVNSERKPPQVTISNVVAAFEEIFAMGARYVKDQGLGTRLVYKTTTPVADTPHTTNNYWWMAWPSQVEPLLIDLARSYGWDVFDAREVVGAAARQGLLASWDAFHLYPYVYQELNDLLLNIICPA